MSTAMPPMLAEAFLRLCQGDFAYRLPRTGNRDEADTSAFVFNSVAEEVSRLVTGASEQEHRLQSAVERISAALIAVAAGDFSAHVDRDFKGDPVDVLAMLVNNTIGELGRLVGERQRQATELRRQLELQVAQRTQQLQESEATLRALFEAAPIALVLTSLESNTILGANRAATQLFGVALSDAVGKPVPSFYADPADRDALLLALQRDGQVDEREVRFRRPSGEEFWGAISVRRVRVDGTTGLLSGVRDITLQRSAAARLHELATTDALTGMLNRRRLFELAGEELDRSERYGRPLSLAMLDIDHFKAINDRFGHHLGDDALVAVARTVREQVRRQDAVGRYGGEEFAVLLPETELEAARQVIERVRAQVHALALTSAGTPVPLAVSGGVVQRRRGEPLNAALNRADEALYAAKRGGRNRVVAA